MRVLVTGSNGMVGAALAAHLRASGCDVLGSVRRTPEPGEIRVGDLDAATDWSLALRGREVVVHAAARVHQMAEGGMAGMAEYRRVNVEGALNLARQAAAVGVRRFVFISSVKAMGEGGFLKSGDDCRPVDAYGISKREAESALLQFAGEAAMELVILRLPLVYGRGVGANFLRLLRLVEKGVPLPFALVDNARSLIGLRNLVDVIELCMRHPAAAGGVFLPSDGKPVSTANLVRCMARAFGTSSRLLPVPVAPMRLAAALLGKRALADRLFGSLAVDSTSLTDRLGWHPPFDFQNEIDHTVAWYLGEKQRHETRP